jgi:dihydroxyacid dehydratase/phosphogluconate dehydratase
LPAREEEIGGLGSRGEVCEEFCTEAALRSRDVIERLRGPDRSKWAGKPVIAIINTWRDISPCHMHSKQRVEEVKRGIWQAGGFPVFARHITQANEGCDFDVLQRGVPTPDPEIH